MVEVKPLCPTEPLNTGELARLVRSQSEAVKYLQEKRPGLRMLPANIDNEKELKMPLATVLFCSKKDIQARPAWPNWAVISVSDTCSSYPVNLKPGWERVLRLEFDDIEFEQEPYQLFSSQQGREVIEFVQDFTLSGGEGILVHCNAGISRSAAIAKWVAERYLLPFPNRYDHYNKHVFNVLREEHMLVGW
jgi:hypothetical protein